MLSRIERLLSGMKFAVVLLVILSFLMIAATIVESLGGAKVASVLIYRSPLFLLLEGLLFVSVSLTILKRLPVRKIFLGFYLLHVGILLLLIGSFVTYSSGVDGSLSLVPNGTSRQVELSRKFFYLQDAQGGFQKFLLPQSFLPTSLDAEVGKVTLDKYLPFSRVDLEWSKGDSVSIELSLSGDEKLILTTSAANKQFTAFGQLGTKQYLLVDKKFADCIKRADENSVLLLNYKDRSCEKIKEIQKSKMGNRYFLRGKYKFFPAMTPYPMNLEHSFVPGLWLLAISKKNIIDERIVMIGPERKLLSTDMNVTFRKEQVPTLRPKFAFPYKNKDGSESAKSFIRFVFEDERYYLSSGESISLKSKDGTAYQAFIASEFFELDFEITLEKFKMEMNPGTQMPASFESFVRLKDGGDILKHHIFMNHPLKHKQFTFYQSSYYETKEGYGSVLSVNYDPGRILKYLGSLFLVLGALLHYYLSSKREQR